jgi:hypothetical protein
MVVSWDDGTDASGGCNQALVPKVSWKLDWEHFVLGILLRRWSADGNSAIYH